MALLVIFLPVLFLYSQGSQPIGRTALADPILLTSHAKKLVKGSVRPVYD